MRSMAMLSYAAVALAIAACAAPPVRYYSLSGSPVTSAAPVVAPGMPGGAGPAGAAGKGPPQIHIDVGPVGVPERLARPQLVIRSNDGDDASTRVRVLEQQRWSSSFDSELRDAFGSAIAARAGAVDVTRGGRLPGHPVYRISIRVQHFEAILDDRVDARIGWTITRSDDNRSAICQAAVSGAGGKGLDDLVQGVQAVVAQAADRIATQVVQLNASGKAACPAPQARSAGGPEGLAASSASWSLRHNTLPEADFGREGTNSTIRGLL